jgi:flagellar basal body-associated protein FliL
MGDKMHKKSKTLLIIIKAIIIILTVLAGLTFAADSSKLAAAFTNLRAYANAGRYISYVRDIPLACLLSSVLLFRVPFFKKQQ